jgi:hypothetical protein
MNTYETFFHLAVSSANAKTVGVGAGKGAGCVGKEEAGCWSRTDRLLDRVPRHLPHAGRRAQGEASQSHHYKLVLVHYGFWWLATTPTVASRTAGTLRLK